jgi:carbon-monoxide dehydrogenase small subunit
MTDNRERIVTLQNLAVEVTVNGKSWKGEVAAEEVLLEFLRHRLELTGTKRSCESQVCGACTVLVDGSPVSACSYFAFEVNGKAVMTIEGLASSDQIDPLQAAFIRNVGAQCGFCTSGQIMTAKALLIENPSPTRHQVAEWMKGNLCRCGCYPAIAKSVLEAAEQYNRGTNDLPREKQT